MGGLSGEELVVIAALGAAVFGAVAVVAFQLARSLGKIGDGLLSLSRALVTNQKNSRFN